MLQILSLLFNVAGLVCFVMVLIKLFQQKGALHGILGLICGLYTFIWGWMESSRLNIKNIMIIWSILLLVGIVLNMMGMGAAVAAAKSAQ